MTSYHEYNKVEKAHALIAKMAQGQDVALITDAGTPAISDPGEVLVKLCHEAGIHVTSLPGAAAGFLRGGFALKAFCRRTKRSGRRCWRNAAARAAR